MAAKLTNQEIIEIKLALHELNADFCHLLDHGETDQFADLFTEDAIYTHGTRASHGRAAIHALFDERNRTGSRTSRHLQTGIRIHVNDGCSAKGSCLTARLLANQNYAVAISYLQDSASAQVVADEAESSGVKAIT